MKFITEADLRNLYRKEPFTTYEIKPGERLTPGGRQYLLDLGISAGNGSQRAPKVPEHEQILPLVSEGEISEETEKDWRKESLIAKVRSMDAMFLMTAGALLSSDVFLAQEVIDLGKELGHMKNALVTETPEGFSCKACTGIKERDFHETLEDCFEITGFHLQLEKGKELILLHRLRCGLREIEPLVYQLFHQDEGETALINGVIGKVNQSINTLSQMICAVLGGKKCQKKS